VAQIVSVQAGSVTQPQTELIDMSDTEITILIGNRPAPTLHELFDFEPGIGLRWRIQCGRARAGQRAGTAHHSGFRRIGIDGGSFRADRLADLYFATQHDRTRI
jgi:hypothetical protein